MNRYLPEPPLRPDQAGHTAILLVNLGTPDAPDAPSVRRYLKEFLWDPRVVEIPRPLWWLILNGIILNVRPAKSAGKYAKIWTPDGSPLKVHTAAQAKLLQGCLGEAGRKDVRVAFAMRYGNPSVGETLSRLKQQGAARILIVPLYPQFAASTTASVMDAVAAWVQATRNPPELRVVRSYPDHPGYIAALAGSVRDYWAASCQGSRPQTLVMSFHGIPKRSLDLGDPYFHEAQRTGRALAAALGLGEADYRITFQSRFGRAEWLQPYTQATLEQLGRAQKGRVDVICPGFTADCLETLEEISIECREAFLAAGGREFNYIPCLNQRTDWVSALCDLAQPHLTGW